MPSRRHIGFCKALSPPRRQDECPWILPHQHLFSRYCFENHSSPLPAAGSVASTPHVSCIWCNSQAWPIYAPYSPTPHLQSLAQRQACDSNQAKESQLVPNSATAQREISWEQSQRRGVMQFQSLEVAVGPGCNPGLLVMMSNKLPFCPN